MASVELLFFGSGTSAGVPMIGCQCDVCTSTDPHDKRMRPSVVISYNGTRVLVDTTPELRLQAIAHNVHRIDAVVMTHAHADHMMGFDDLRRFNFVAGGPLNLWGEEATIAALKRCFGYAFEEPPADMRVFRPYVISHPITGPFEIAGVTWAPIPLMHGSMPILGFRVGNLAYCTDVSFIPETTFPLLEGLDVLVLDALQHKKHITHFSVEQAIQAAQRIGAKQTLFTHIGHTLPHEATNRTLPPNIRLAYDGEVAVASL
jgi:phosphoribosyl 1,2-cyclic phosphate phosphodiesterase